MPPYSHVYFATQDADHGSDAFGSEGADTGHSPLEGPRGPLQHPGRRRQRRPRRQVVNPAQTTPGGSRAGMTRVTSTALGSQGVLEGPGGGVTRVTSRPSGFQGVLGGAQGGMTRATSIPLGCFDACDINPPGLPGRPGGSHESNDSCDIDALGLSRRHKGLQGRDDARDIDPPCAPRAS